MASPTITELTNAIANTLAAAGATVQALDTLSESIQDPPLVQVYYAAEDGDATGATARMTLAGNHSQMHVTFNVDAYARQRAHIGQDMLAVAEQVQIIRTVLRTQNKPFFGLAGIGAFHWSASYAPFEYSKIVYAGVRFVVEVWVQ